jgi:NADPH-dependent 2,4-dienoyl-CoA reductase/sulfur reductase-like enzyme
VRILVAGAGLAGLRAAQAARGSGFDGELVLLNAEPHPPYNRPPLSKELLRGEHTAAQCTFPGLDALDAEVRPNASVVAIDPAAHTLTLSDGATEPYDRLIVATGSRAREIGDGADSLRTLDDALALHGRLDRIEHLAIVGAGFIGCEVAASARARGVEVTLIDAIAQPLLPLGPELGARVADLHRSRGVQLRLGTGVQSAMRDQVRLADGDTVRADHVLVAIGVRLNTGFLQGSSIELSPDGGIVCDATLTCVTDPDVLAAGDVAAWPALGGRFGDAVRVEHWTTAAEHGRTAGANATKEPAERKAHVAPPYFWSDQYDVKVQSVGFPALAERIEIVDEDSGSGSPRLVAEAHDAHGRLVGAVTFNHAKRLAEYRRRLAAEAVPA